MNPDDGWEEVLEATYDWEVGMEVEFWVKSYMGNIPEGPRPWVVEERGFIDYVSDQDPGRNVPYFVYLRDNWEGGPDPFALGMGRVYSPADITPHNAVRVFRRSPVVPEE